MKTNTSKDKTNTNKDREEKLRAAARKSRRRSSTAMVILAMLGCLVLLVGLMYGGLTLIDRAVHGGEENQAASDQPADNPDDAVEVISPAIVYSQEELDAKIAEAVLAAQDEEADRVLQGIKAALSEGTTTVEIGRASCRERVF